MEYGKKLMDKLDKYDDMEEEVDFPNWWQSKLIISKEYLQKAYHYLDSEEKTEESINEDYSQRARNFRVALRRRLEKMKPGQVIRYGKLFWTAQGKNNFRVFLGITAS